ncbi:bacteriorhodopsin [Salinarimonas ramus]|uniref:Xanthorhodopsin n=1 Tax=Salinarimonas ramus TaxID=690164 RepID=A0A917Q779_9HYPH|nr:bacteriorhodopsin [Salinarimonas ramus]GGK30629.1 xanthorhodopsin [Salinarimonas ramus]
MPNYENFLEYGYWHFDVIRHIFALTVAAFLAGLAYFIMTMNNVAPRYRLSSVISAVVMVSAALEIFQLWLLWNRTFTFNEASGLWTRVDGMIFSNGYRYANWSIDVPMLLTQLLVVLGFSGRAFWANWGKFTLAGLLMIWTGYVGQYYEPAVAGFSDTQAVAPFWIWGGVSTVFYLYILWLVYAVTHRPPETLSARVAGEMNRIFLLLLVAWTLYPIAYLIPAVWVSDESVLVRQVLFTTADITSKLVFGIMLSRVARHRSIEEGYGPALAVQGEIYPDRIERPHRVREPAE